jgi:hypothetical protein
LAESKNNDDTKIVKELQKELLANLDILETLLEELQKEENSENRKNILATQLQRLNEFERRYSNEPWFAEVKRVFDRLENPTELDNINFETEFNYVERTRKEILEMDDKEKVSISLKVSVSLKVGEAKQQRDVGRSIARMDSETMKVLGVTVGDVVEIIGKKSTAAKAWPAYPEDQGLRLIRIDGFIRKNCDISINEFVTVKKAEAEYAASVKLAPVDIRISVDNDFIRFVKDRLIDRPATRGDTLLITMLGHSVPFNVVETVPDGIIKTGPSTVLSIDPLPISDIEEREAHKRRFRFRRLKEVEEKYAADETWFYTPDPEGGEPKYRSMDESEIIKVAKSVARSEDKIVEIRVELFERRGNIEPEGFKWAEVSPSGKVRYMYPDEWHSSISD